MRFAAMIPLLLSACLCWAGDNNIFNEATFQSLTADARAFRPGDSLTVLIVENASAAASADTNSSSKGALSTGVRSQSTDKFANLSINEESGGKGTIQRSGKLLAQITVSVQAVERSGELVIKGEQLLEFNNEKQQIRLEGRVRPRDISSANTVLSTRIADARISYVGDGILGERQSPGILTRFLLFLGLI